MKTKLINSKNQDSLSKIKVLVFDFWKTLAYPLKNDPQKFYPALGNFGIEFKDQEDVKRFSSLFSKLMCFSKDWINFGEQLLKEFSNNQTKENTMAFADFLKENVAFKLYGDVRNVLDLPYTKAILTDSARFLVEDSELKDFGKIFTPNETNALKPDPKVFLTVINEFKINPEEAVMIGDDIKRDLFTAKKLGMKTILIDRENKFPDYQGVKINSFKELKQLLE